MDQLREEGAPAVSELQVTLHEPGRTWKVQPQQLSRWLRSYPGHKDSVGVRDMKHRVFDFLAEHLGR